MDGEANLTASLRNLFKSMGETSEPFPPFALLSVSRLCQGSSPYLRSTADMLCSCQILRQVAPQFAEMTQGQGGRGYAQQDAEEAWLRLLTALQNSLKGLSAPSADGQGTNGSSFVEQYLTGRMSIK